MFDAQRIDEYIDKVVESKDKVFKPYKRPLKVGLDLGTAYIVLVVLDSDDKPVACEMQAASVLKDGVVVDFSGAQRITRELKEKLEERIGEELTECAIAMPAGTESSVRTHQYVAEGAGLEVINILDEPTAANSIYNIKDGVVVDIGGGTTGLAIFENGKVIEVEDEPTGGTHISLVLAGNYHISFKEAEEIKMNYDRHKEILPVVKATIEKMAHIVSKYIDKNKIDTIYLCGGTCNLTGLEKIFQDAIGVKTIKPKNPFLVTPSGIAMNCVRKEEVDIDNAIDNENKEDISTENVNAESVNTESTNAEKNETENENKKDEGGK